MDISKQVIIPPFTGDRNISTHVQLYKHGDALYIALEFWDNDTGKLIREKMIKAE